MKSSFIVPLRFNASGWCTVSECNTPQWTKCIVYVVPTTKQHFQESKERDFAITEGMRNNRNDKTITQHQQYIWFEHKAMWYNLLNSSHYYYWTSISLKIINLSQLSYIIFFFCQRLEIEYGIFVLTMVKVVQIDFFFLFFVRTPLKNQVKPQNN